MPQQCGLKTEEVVDNKRQTEQGLMTVKWMKNQIQNSELLVTFLLFIKPIAN